MTFDKFPVNQGTVSNVIVNREQHFDLPKVVDPVTIYLYKSPLCALWMRKT